MHLILASGGVETATLLWTLAPRETVVPVCVDYGQRAAERERAAVAAQSRALGLTPRYLDISPAADAFRAEGDHDYHVPLPHRNLVILGLGLSFAARIGADRVAIGVNADDLSAYPSAGQPFLKQCTQLAETLGAARITTPLAQLAKSEVIARGLALGADFRLAYSCLLGRAVPCGRCPQCMARREAFAAAGALDPADPA